MENSGLKLIAIVLAVTCVAPALLAAEAPLPVTGARQLFVDDYLIQKMEKCRLVVHPGKKDPRNPLTGEADSIPGEREGYWSAGRGEVSYPIPKDAAGKNVIPYLYCPCVFHDVLTPDPEEQYKLAIWGNDGLLIAFSRDGKTWVPWGQKPVTFWLRDVLSPSWDPINKRFLLFCQINVVDLPAYSGRVAGLAWSKDFRTWTPVGIVLRPDGQDPPGMQIHCMAGCWYESVYIGFPQMFQTQPERTVGKITEADEIAYTDIQLATSRDGEHWQRAPERTPIIPLGSAAKGDFDAGFITTAARAVQVGDEVWLHYHGSSWPQLTGGAERHTEAELAPIRKVPRNHGSGMARWRLDGFVSVRADGEGLLTTKPLVAAGDKLLVNADASHGRLFVEIRDQAGSPIPGLAEADVEPMASDEIHHIVKFGGRDDFMKPLAGKTVSLRFRLKDADLYSFQFQGALNPIEPIVVGSPQQTLPELPSVAGADAAVEALAIAASLARQGRTYDAKRIGRAVLARTEVNAWPRVRPMAARLMSDQLEMYEEIRPFILGWLNRTDLSPAERAELCAALVPIMKANLAPAERLPMARRVRDNAAADPKSRRAASGIVMKTLADESPESVSMPQLQDALIDFELTLGADTGRYVSHELPLVVLRNLALKNLSWRQYAINGALASGAAWFPEPDYDWFLHRMQEAFEVSGHQDRFDAYRKYFQEGGQNPAADLVVSFPEEVTAPTRKWAEGRGDSPDDLMVRGRVAFVTGQYKEAGRLFLRLYDHAAAGDKARQTAALDYLKRIALCLEMRPGVARAIHTWQRQGAKPGPDSPIEPMRKLVAE